MTLSEAKSLRHGQTLYHHTLRNADGSPLRVRVTGKVKTWKTRPGEVRVPAKHGLYAHTYITQAELAHWCLVEAEALRG